MMPEIVKAIRWSDLRAAGTFPPNFSFALVRDVAELGPAFLRVTLEGEDLSRFGDDAIHFRLVQSPKDVDPCWPSVETNGSVVWPEGPGAPHRPVYTARCVDRVGHRLVTDVFLHEGGRTTRWAQELMAGERDRSIVGLLGPSGGGMLTADRVLLASDETGFPAAARLLENLPDGATGHVLLEAEDGSACNYPISVPSGIALTWLSRSRGDVLAEATLDVLPRHAGAKIWFAGERHQASRVRDAAKVAGWNADDLRISAFWKSHTLGG